jgi:hypothetical protein
MDQTTSRICPWCSTEIPATSSACPKCKALVEGATADIPGLTVVDPTSKTAMPDEGLVPDVVDLKAILQAGRDAPDNPEAFARPSEEVRAEMRRMELAAQIANAGTVVMSPTGDESIEVGAPSEEALMALEAGLLDDTGPGGEDLHVLAEPWEDPELEQRVTGWQADPDEK